MNTLIRYITLCVALMAPGLPAHAHKLQVFAFADGARIEGSAYFAGGGKAADSRIRIDDAAGQTLAELTTAADGSFEYLARAPIEHRIIAFSGDGHRATWRIGAAELAGGFPDRGGAAEPSSPPSAERAARPEPQPATQVSDDILRTAIDQAVARQITPLRQELLALRNDLRLQDILGGIGYIFGIAGLAMWWRARSASRKP